MESGTIYIFNFTNVILVVRQLKKDGQEARFPLDILHRNKAVRNTIMEMPNTRMLLDFMAQFKFRPIMDLID